MLGSCEADRLTRAWTEAGSQNFVRGKCAGWSAEFRRRVLWLSMHAGLYTRQPSAQNAFFNPYEWRLAHNSHAWRRAYAARMERSLRTECGQPETRNPKPKT